MHHASEKKKRSGKNPQVSVRLNVRPLCANWKPVKRYECDGKKREASSPAEDQLDATVWKTKTVRTDVINAIAVLKEGEVKKDKEHAKTETTEGLVLRCDCASCERADETPTALEQSPKETRDDLFLEKKKRIREKNKRRNSKSKSSNQRKRNQRRRHSESSTSTHSHSTPFLVPPNSVISPESQHHWCKLYEEAHHTIKPIDFKKIVTVPGQIGMSELEPEDPATPPPTANTPQKVHPHRSPNVSTIKPLPVSPMSNMTSPMFKPSPTSHQPPLVPQPPAQPQSNIIIHPAPIENSSMLMPNQAGVQMNSKNSGIPLPTEVQSESNSSLVYMPSSPVSHENASHSNSNVSIIRKMENAFYSSESNWWFLVALVMLTIFAYRSSIDQHTCYYD